jgi:hypothetical protein
MRRILTIAVTALAAALLLAPAAAQARSSHHRASAADRNGDRIPDRWERHHRLSLKVKQTKRDQDRDGLNNLGEFRAGTNPRDRDTDNDGVRDGAEHRFGMNPRDDDSDNDGREDGDENAGTVQSFTGGVLTIALASGGTVSGRVVDGTEIECRSATPTATATSHGDDDEGDDDRGDDNSGPSSNSGPGNARDDDGDDGDDENENENEDENERNCSSADLTPNTVVREAELKLVDGSAVFREVEIVK